MLLGKKISEHAIFFDLPAILIFSSTFCSKCLWNKRLLEKYELFEKRGIEIDISKKFKIIEELKPPSVPYIIIINKHRTILAEKEGMMTTIEAEIFVKTFEKLLELENL